MRLSVLSLMLLPFLPLSAAEALAPVALLDLPESPGLATCDGELHWHAHAVAGTDPNHDVLLTLAGTKIAVRRALVEADDGEAAQVLPVLLARAQAAGLDPSTLRLDRGLLTGVHLRGTEVLVLTDAVLRQQSFPPISDRRPALSAAVRELTTQLASSSLPALARGAVTKVLDRLLENDDPEDEFPPALARHLLRRGWLDQDLAKLPGWNTFAAALRSALALEPQHRWSGDDITLSEYSDACGRRVWTVQGPHLSARLEAHVSPSYGQAAPRLVLSRYAPGCDPLGDGMPIAAELWWGRRQLATWTTEGGLHCDEDVWRAALPDDAVGTGANTEVGWRPPHLVLCDGDGAVLALCLDTGVLRPPIASDAADRERFLSDAARLAPDAARLDLIGQYLFAYVHDSPDPTRPWLIGVKGLTGEIHQTVDQTLGTCCAGMMRGDCDDLSEVYHALLTRQGRLPQLFALPGHSACGWSTKEGDRWTTHILHTGQPLAFTGDTLEESLEQTFNHFDSHNTDGGSLVHLALRFAGENTRTHWRLGSRIMRDADYARTMIAVQRDWHYHTFAQGIRTMQAMLAAGDDDSANWSELSGLYRRTGQWDLGIAAEKKTLERISDPRRRLDSMMTLLSLQERGERHRDAAYTAEDLRQQIEHSIPTQEDELRRHLLQRLRDWLSANEHRALRRSLLLDHLLPTVERQTRDVTAWARTRFDHNMWDGGLRDYRAQAGDVIGAAMEELAHADTANDPIAQRLVTFAERWLNDLAFVDRNDRSEIMASYASVGHFAACVVGTPVFDALLEHAALPQTWIEPPTLRVGGLAQLQRDLPWIKLSVPYWAARVESAVNVATSGYDEALAMRLLVGLQAAGEASARIGIEDPGMDQSLRWGRLVRVLLGRDAMALRTEFSECASRQDRRTDELVVDTIVELAHQMPPGWFATVLSTWQATAATRPGYFAIAWGCALRGAVAPALTTSALAAHTFADDPTFVAEAAYLQQVLAGGAEP